MTWCASPFMYFKRLVTVLQLRLQVFVLRKNPYYFGHTPLRGPPWPPVRCGWQREQMAKRTSDSWSGPSKSPVCLFMCHWDFYLLFWVVPQTSQTRVIEGSDGKADIRFVIRTLENPRVPVYVPLGLILAVLGGSPDPSDRGHRGVRWQRGLQIRDQDPRKPPCAHFCATGAYTCCFGWFPQTPQTGVIEGSDGKADIRFVIRTLENPRVPIFVPLGLILVVLGGSPWPLRPGS